MGLKYMFPRNFIASNSNKLFLGQMYVLSFCGINSSHFSGNKGLVHKILFLSTSTKNHVLVFMHQ